MANADALLYLQDSYLKEFDATDEEVREDLLGPGTGIWVRLDRTAFYPQGGGQPNDTGNSPCGCGVPRD